MFTKEQLDRLFSHPKFEEIRAIADTARTKFIKAKARRMISPANDDPDLSVECAEFRIILASMLKDLSIEVSSPESDEELYCSIMLPLLNVYGPG